MVPFFLDVELNDKVLILTVEQLQHFADVDGYCRCDITAGNRRAVVYVDVGYEDPQPPVTPEAMENLYEAIHYPEKPQACTEMDEELFTTSELNRIGGAIRGYNREAGISFPELNFDL